MKKEGAEFMAKKQQKPTSRKGRNALIIIGVIIVVLVIGLLIINPPAKNLGVKWTEADATSAGVKLGRERVELPTTENPAESVRFEGSHPVDESFSSEELTAIVNTRDYAYSPAKNVQIRLNDDGSGEVSGTINVANIIPFGEAFKIRNERAKEVIQDYVEQLPINPTFYVKGTPSITNNQAHFEADEIKIGRFDVTDKLSPNQINTVVEQNIKGVPGLSVNELSIENGELHFDGTYPDKSMYAPE